MPQISDNHYLITDICCFFFENVYFMHIKLNSQFSRYIKEKKLKYTFYLFIFIIFSTTNISEKTYAAEKNNKSIPVFVSIQPLAYFVENIGKKLVKVDVLLLPGKSPATYAPTPKQIEKLVNSKLFFRTGLPFENKLIHKIEHSATNIQIIDLRKDIRLRKMNRTHPDHGKKQNHQHDIYGVDPHIWLSPILAKKQAETIYKALVEFNPEHKNQFMSNYITLIKKLDGLHSKIKRALAASQGETMFVFHPAFGYFADTYGLKQMAVEIEGKTPKGKDISIFIQQAKKKKVRIIFVQPQFDRSAAQKIASLIGGAVIPLDPLAKNYIKNLEDMADKVAKAF